MRAAARDVDAVLGAQLVAQPLDQRRQAGAVLVFVGRRIGRARSRTASIAARRRTVVHDALSERNRAGHLRGSCRRSPDTIGACTASIRVLRFQRSVHDQRAIDTRTQAELTVGVRRVLSVESTRDIIVVVPGGLMFAAVARRSRARADVHARRDRGRHRCQTPEQFLGFTVGADNKLVALGQDRRLHEARRRQLRPRALPRAGQDEQTATRSSRSKSARPRR